jgi:hypothetical protein
MFDAFVPLHKSFVLMCSFRFYFVRRKFLKFEFDVNSKWFANLKRI